MRVATPVILYMSHSSKRIVFGPNLLWSTANRPQLVATVDRDAVRTRLWIEPHHGTEAYLAEVERTGGRLRMRHCRGDRDGAGQAEGGRCPEGWQRIQLD